MAQNSEWYKDWLEEATVTVVQYVPSSEKHYHPAALEAEYEFSFFQAISNLNWQTIYGIDILVIEYLNIIPVLS